MVQREVVVDVTHVRLAATAIRTVALVFGRDQKIRRQPRKFVEHPDVVGVDVLERLDGVDHVEGAVVEGRKQIFQGTIEEGASVDEVRVVVGQHVERVGVDVDAGEVRKALPAEVFEVAAGATAHFEDCRVLGRVVVEDVAERLADLVRTDFGVVGRRVLPGAVGPVLAHLLGVHTHSGVGEGEISRDCAERGFFGCRGDGPPMAPEDDPIAEDAYDALADEYAAEVRESPYNAHLEFPATSDLVPDVDGKRVLDAGCGTGVYTEWLLAQGASEVVGVDVSEAMLSHARETVGDADGVGDRVTFHRADLAEPLDVADDGSFDGIVSALALSYVEDWRSTFAEFARVLRPGGFLVFSTGHPLDTLPDDESQSYFEVDRAVKEWSVEVPFYRRPFGEMINPLLAAGFGLDRVVEPQPTEGFREAMPERYEKESRYPVFLCVRAFERSGR